MTREKISINPINPLERGQEFLVTGEAPTTFRGSKIIYATSLEDTQVVIKIPKDGQDAEKEWTGLTKSTDAGIPVPKPMLLGLNDSGHPCVVLERIYGTPLFLSHNYEDRTQLGQTIRQMHTRVKIKDSEWLKNGMSNYGYYDKKIKLWGEKPGLFQILSLPMIDYCNRVLPVFNHNDIHDGQVIKLDKDKHVLIDFGNWTEDRPMNDLGFYLFHCLRSDTKFEMFKGFMNGYLGRDSLEEVDKQALIFNLLFISTRAIFKYLTYQTDYLEIARENHQKVLNFIQSEILWKAL